MPRFSFGSTDKFRHGSDRYVEDGRFLDLKKLNLNNNYFDTTQVREAISYQAYRDASVPAARTAFARVYLTIADRAEKISQTEDEIKGVYLGLYTIVEQQDVDALERHTGETGVLLKPEKQVLPYLGDHWDARYEEFYQPRTKVGSAAGKIVVDLARLQDDYRQGWYRDGDAKDPTTMKNNQQNFQRRLESVLDIDNLLRYLAVTTLIGNGDSPLLMFPHNYYLAIPEKSRRVLWLPWDLNNSIGGMGQYFGVPFEELSIYHGSNMPLLVRILQVPA
ncbi:MAG TPA: hypothetical protein EYG38_08055 [Verrucomicrobia bacterium]|nr:hypothetical protein [Verrucomicrobiota bacterium]